MRVLDPRTPLHPRRVSRKKKPLRFQLYFKCRVRVPADKPSVAHRDDDERFENDWAPNLRGLEGIRDEVEVSVRGDIVDKVYRITIWGDDDLGYEKEYNDNATTVVDLVRYVLSFPEPLTFEWLEAHDFVPC